ncbi:MAG: hypothetical protein GY729_06480 [Desulfobacteraceae bacterium]|nr:hypothetical protein [Desulfobacteraceae bacterium]
MSKKPISESDLFEPVQDYLIKQGYTVKAEVLHCDITATKEDELVVIELKKNLNLSLLVQAANRQKFADSVYVAVALDTGKKRPRNWKGACHLLKRLELGLILITFLKTKTKVEIIFHPSEFKKKKSHKKRRHIIREISGRTGNFNTGGSSGKKIITAYREQAIHIACLLVSFNELSPARLRKMGTSKKTQRILYDNHYRWFERVKRGVYRLHPQGKKALKQYPDLMEHYNIIIQKQQTS